MEVLSLKPVELLSLTVRDVARSLYSQTGEADSKCSTHDIDDNERRDLKALICIDSRTAYLALLEFLSLRFGLPISDEQGLLDIARKQSTEECAIIASALEAAARSIRGLKTEDGDPYLHSVMTKVKSIEETN